MTDEVMLTLGVSARKSVGLTIPAFSIVLASKTEIDTGVSISLVLRFRPVTTISPLSAAAASAGATVSCAKAGWQARETTIAAMETELALTNDLSVISPSFC
ncbi:hypothetical protein [Novosphingobium sp. MD-1]|uniref:hypothetical protein n=1 Tax=Novosphingobium sp. MD-1 TaxID=1630648 RepID=UPI001F299DD3|nr:hypothetical protein [Novosphingobium sp. MD-1]